MKSLMIFSCLVVVFFFCPPRSTYSQTKPDSKSELVVLITYTEEVENFLIENSLKQMKAFLNVRQKVTKIRNGALVPAIGIRSNGIEIFNRVKCDQSVRKVTGCDPREFDYKLSDFPKKTKNTDGTTTYWSKANNTDFWPSVPPESEEEAYVKRFMDESGLYLLEAFKAILIASGVDEANKDGIGSIKIKLAKKSNEDELIILDSSGFFSKPKADYGVVKTKLYKQVSVPKDSVTGSDKRPTKALQKLLDEEKNTSSGGSGCSLAQLAFITDQMLADFEFCINRNKLRGIGQEQDGGRNFVSIQVDGGNEIERLAKDYSADIVLSFIATSKVAPSLSQADHFHYKSSGNGFDNLYKHLTILADIRRLLEQQNCVVIKDSSFDVKLNEYKKWDKCPYNLQRYDFTLFKNWVGQEDPYLVSPEIDMMNDIYHELGHTLGCGHSNISDQAPERDILREYALGYQNDGFGTIMAAGTGEPNLRSIFTRFSNPDLKFPNNVRMGNAESADCARTIGENTPLVAKIR